MIAIVISFFRYYKQLAEKAMLQIDDATLFHQYHEEDNSIGIIVQHMVGNMKSRWTNIFTEDGEKPWRDRDIEFISTITERESLLITWEEGWKVLFETLDGLTEEDLSLTLKIRNENITIAEAIIRQLCHYSYHCGQIVYKCKQTSAGSWTSLSIPKNESKSYNFKKFEQISKEKKFLDSLFEEGK